MWQSHFVVLKEEPSADQLAKLRDGYQLWRESRTGLYYLTTHQKPLRRRPDFSGSLEVSGQLEIDVSALKRFMEEPPGTLNLTKAEVNFYLIEQVAYLSKQLGMAVLCAEDTDDYYGMAVMVDMGEVQYLRIKSTLSEPEGELGFVPGVEVLYHAQSGFELDHDPVSDAYGVAQSAIRDIFGVANLNLFNYADEKPTREQVKARGDAPKSIAAYLDSYGVFKRISHAEPQLTWKDKAMRTLRFGVLIPLYPFIVAGLFGSIFLFDKRIQEDADVPFWIVIPLGAAILAIPILILVWMATAFIQIAFTGI